MDKNELIKHASKGYIKDFYSQSNYLTRDSKTGFGSLPNFNRQKALDAIRKDSTVQSAVTTLVDKSLENGYKFKFKGGKSNKSMFENKMEKVGFDMILRQTMTQVFGYQNAFIENVKDGNEELKEYQVLETTQTEPVVDKHGTIVGYVQTIPIADNRSDANIGAEWTPDEVTHIKVNPLTNSPWSDFDIERIYTSVLIKQYIYKYVGWLFGSNQFRNFYNVKDASDDQVKDFITYLKSAQKDLQKPLIAEGEVTNQILRDFKDGDQILAWVNKCDRNILDLMQVPPIAGGETGQSNRSSSDKQDQMLATRIKSIHRLVEFYLNTDLFPKSGFDKVSIKFNPVLRNDISKLLEEAERMKNMGFGVKQIEEYLEMAGFPIEGELFDREAIKAAKEQFSQGKSEDMYPSRKRKLDGESNKQIGTGENGTTRKDQVAQGLTINWSSDSKARKDWGLD